MLIFLQVVKSENVDQTVFHVKYSFQQEAYKVVVVGRRSRRLRRHKDEDHHKPQPLTLKRAYQAPRPIAQAKLRDLIQLCDKNIIPICHQQAYRKLKTDETAQDCLPEGDIEDGSSDEETD